jgi:hypothetical protein
MAADGCLSAGRYRCAGRRLAVMPGRAAIAARMLAASPAGMPAVLVLPRGITAATAWPAGGLAQGQVRRGPAHD